MIAPRSSMGIAPRFGSCPQSVFNRDWVPGYPVMTIVPGSRMGIVPRSSSVISDDCDCAYITLHIMPWLVSRSSMEMQLSPDRVSWHLMIAMSIVARWILMICHDCSWIEYWDCVWIQSFLTRDWVSWYPVDAHCALTEFRGIRWLRLWLSSVSYYVTMPWLPLDWAWGMFLDSDLLESWFSFLVSGGSELCLDRVSSHPMIAIVVEPRSSFILCHNCP